MFSEKQLSVSLIFSVASLFSILFISFNLYYFSPSANFGFNLFFSGSEVVKLDADFRSF